MDGLNDKLEEAKERERLIVEYPDINGPVNKNINGKILLIIAIFRKYIKMQNICGYNKMI